MGYLLAFLYFLTIGITLATGIVDTTRVSASAGWFLLAIVVVNAYLDSKNE